MTADSFRRAALALPEAIESAHMNHPDFRVANRIFATLGYPDAAWGMVLLPSEEQRRLVEAMPDAFTPAKGKWGENGSTLVCLAKVKAETVMHALDMAWQHAQAKQKTAKAKTMEKAPTLKTRSQTKASKNVTKTRTKA